MSAFVVILHDDEPDANKVLRERIKEGFPGDQHYEFSDTVHLITGVRLIEQIASKLGFEDEDDDEALGVVLRLNGSYQGRSYSKLWDWMRAANEYA